MWLLKDDFMTFEGSDWYLARRVASTSACHPANDNLVGTAAYGEQGTDPTEDATWSVPFGNDFTQYLLASGDMSMWVIIAKDELADRCAAGCANCGMTLMGSHMGGEPVGQYCRAGAQEDEGEGRGDGGGEGCGEGIRLISSFPARKILFYLAGWTRYTYLMHAPPRVLHELMRNINTLTTPYFTFHYTLDRAEITR